MKDPAFLFYYQDFLVGTAFLSLEEIGAYMLLLCHQADLGRIPVEEVQSIISKQMSKSSSAENAEAIWKGIQSKFKVEGHYIYNKRLKAEVKKRKAYSASRRTNRLGDKNKKKEAVKAPTEKQPKPTTTAVTAPTLQTLCRNIFEKYYFDIKSVKYYYDAKQAAALKGILNKIKASAVKELTVEQTCEVFAALLNSITDKFVLDNLDLSMINSQFNKLLATLKKAYETNDNGSTQRTGNKWSEVLNDT